MPERTPAADLHAASLVIDAHADTPQRFLDEDWDFTSALEHGMINLETARRGNLAAEFFAIWVQPEEYAGNYARRARALIECVHEQVRRHPEELQLCVSPADILSARAAGRFGVLLGLEGGHAIENSLDTLREFYRLGVRYMTLTWSNTNDWCDSSGDAPRHNGLTEFGHEVIREMNRLGMMIDVSHVSDQAFDVVLEVSSAPVLATHSSARGVTPAFRNLTDDQLRALAAKGGVAMVNFYPAFVDDAWREAWNVSREEREAMQEDAARPFHAAGIAVPFHVCDGIDRTFAARIGRPPLASLLAHFDHMIRVAGVEHVGIGTDFDGICALPEGINSAADLPRITEGLLERGHSAGDVAKTLGGNTMRVFRAVQERAAQR